MHTSRRINRPVVSMPSTMAGPPHGPHQARIRSSRHQSYLGLTSHGLTRARAGIVSVYPVKARSIPSTRPLRPGVWAAVDVLLAIGLAPMCVYSAMSVPLNGLHETSWLSWLVGLGLGL